MPKAKRSHPKPCGLCHTPSTIRYRIQCTKDAAWVLVCPVCQAQQSDGNPYYRYGGTWKAKR